MSAVVERITDIQKAQPEVVPLPDESPVRIVGTDDAGVDDGGVVAKRLNELQRPVRTDGQELLKNRFLCRGAGLLMVGPTGIGKSSLSMQMMISWALGRPLFGIEPARPIKSLLIQAENDDGDLAEMRDGVFSGLNVSDADRELACSRIFVVQENTRTSEEFFNETVRPMLEAIKPDLVWIDPALAYLGGENNSQQAVGAFLRNQLNPLLTEFNCAAVVIHHTNKPYSGQDKRGPLDFAYLGGGSAEWANWSRAILTLQKTDAANVFELRAAKRGNRLGWKEADGTTVAYNRFIAHNKEPGTICWLDVDPELVDGLNTGNGKTAEDVMKHVPHDRPVAKNALITTCSKNGLGKTKARDFIDDLVRDGRLFEWQRQRKSAQPEKYLARFPRPEGLSDEAILTILLTGFSACEDRCEEHNDRSSQPHGPLGPERNGCEDRKEHGEVALLPVKETSAREDRPHEDLPAKEVHTGLPRADVPENPTTPPVGPIPPPQEETVLDRLRALKLPAAKAPQSSSIANPGVVRNSQQPPVQMSPPVPATSQFPKMREPCPPNPELLAAIRSRHQGPTYADTLLELGQILLNDEESMDWMSLQKISNECKKHWKSLPQLNYSLRSLSDWAEGYFHLCGELRGQAVKVRAKPKWNEGHRRDELLLQFVKVYPDGTCN